MYHHENDHNVGRASEHIHPIHDTVQRQRVVYINWRLLEVKHIPLIIFHHIPFKLGVGMCKLGIQQEGAIRPTRK